MSEYREIQGAAVQSLASNTGTIEGQIWYDNVNGAFKLESTIAVGGGTWATGNTFNTARGQTGGAGSADAGFIAGGFTPAAAITNASEDWDGSSWTTSGNLNTSRADLMCAGTQTAGLGAAGDDFPGPPRGTTASEEYNGSVWSNGNPTNNGHYESPSASNGTSESSASIIGGRNTPANTRTNNFELYDGTSWTNGPAYPAALGGIQSFGADNTSVVATGGETDPGTVLTSVNEYNGVSWASATALPAAKRAGGASGIQTNGIVFGGTSPATPNQVSTVSYNGSSWTSEGDLNNYIAGAGTSKGITTNAWVAGTRDAVNRTEIFSGYGIPTTKTITTT